MQAVQHHPTHFAHANFHGLHDFHHGHLDGHNAYNQVDGPMVFHQYAPHDEYNFMHPSIHHTHGYGYHDVHDLDLNNLFNLGGMIKKTAGPASKIATMSGNPLMGMGIKMGAKMIKMQNLNGLY